MYMYPYTNAYPYSFWLHRHAPQLRMGVLSVCYWCRRMSGVDIHLLGAPYGGAACPVSLILLLFSYISCFILMYSAWALSLPGQGTSHMC